MTLTKKYKVCIIEDDSSILEIYERKISQSGFEVVTAKDGEEGWNVLKKEFPDIALIDIMMPKMDGIELMKKMKEDEELSKIPVIILTNLEDYETVKKTSNLQSRFYLVKALFNPQKVVDLIKEVLRVP